MQQHLVYIVSPTQMDQVQAAMTRLHAQELESDTASGRIFQLDHILLGDLKLEVSVLTDLAAINLHMRQHPVDLLVYDERGGGTDALIAMKKIRKEVRHLAELWGPDFHFPLSKTIAILEKDDPSSHRAFQLGRLNVRDVLIAPPNTAKILRWIYQILCGGIIRKNKVGMALSGGGIEGLLYQIGVIHALNRALTDRDLHDIDVISGVSSGALAGALVAVQLDAAEVIRSVHRKSKVLPSLTSKTVFDLATASISKRLFKESLSWRLNPQKWFPQFIRSIPTGFFKGNAIEEYLRTTLAVLDHPDEFDALKTELYVGATDQDTFQHITFGKKKHRNVKITEALRASCAFPLIFTPKAIRGRRYIDGQVTQSCNLDIIIQRGCRLVFVIDPLKPMKNHLPGTAEAEGGFFSAVQVVKALCSTRFEANLKHIAGQHPDTDFIVFQPDAKCAELMAGSPMKYRIRTQLVELAYKTTLRKLRDRYKVYQVKLARYGFQLCSLDRLRELERNYDQVFETFD